MEQLSGIDSLLLFEEHGNVFGHLCGLGFYNPATAPGGKVRFRAILDEFERRLPSARIFRRRLVEAPLGLDRPYWINEPDVDVEYHVRHIALPHPGDWRQLMIQVARIHSRPLDHNMPLWEVYIIEGLENIPELPPGTFAALFKFHAAGLAGQTVGHAIRLVHGERPTTGAATRPPHHALVADREPGTLTLIANALVNQSRRGWRLAAGSARSGFSLASLGSAQLRASLRSRLVGAGETAANGAVPCYRPAPATRFNAPLTSARVLECVALPQGQIDAIRAAVPQATLNDVFLATLGGALRHYLKAKDELPAISLSALIPAQLGTPGFAGSIGPGALGLPMALRTDVRDPLQRLRAIHLERSAARHNPLARAAQRVSPDLLGDLPHAVVEQGMRLGLLPQVNVIAAQYDGSAAPLYLAGAEAIAFYPIGRALDGAALNISAFSYREALWIGVNACRHALPDPALFAEALRAAFGDLLRAAEKKTAPSSTAEARPRTRRRAA
jgi:WS/DGAT/MGAT family acyltransferase